MQSSEWTGKKVRDAFVKFFESKDHLNVVSSSVVPLNDPTLLFTNAGMNQFKAIFLGQVDPNSHQATWKRAANSQKCIRAGGKHNDLDDVGKDTYHHTFFEMLGNWSFGDYFKEEAIGFAWELLTEVFGLDPNRIYASYFCGAEDEGLASDEEAKQIWLKYLPEERVLPFDKTDNFWEMGDTGPCGPCSEIHYDRIGGRDAAALVNADDPNVIEIWNLVFIQFNREVDQSLTTLPAKHVDTGMGFERVTSILQNVTSNYDTDIFQRIFEEIQKVTGAEPYTGKVGEEDEGHKDMAYRILADHIRTLTFAITDGASPGPTDRNYVLRRVLRRAVRYGKTLGAQPGFFSQLVNVVVEVMGDAFPELKKDPERVIKIIAKEERLFGKTLDTGCRKFNQIVAKMEAKGETVISGGDIWKLYATYGFPKDLIQLMAEEKGLSCDLASFHEAFERMRELSQRKSNKGSDESHLKLQAAQVSDLEKQFPVTDDSPKFNAQKDIKATVQAIWTTDKTFVDSASDAVVGVVLDKTNFYSEQGGQVSDIGMVGNLTVDDVQIHGGYVLHIGSLNGEMKVGDVVKCSVDWSHRVPIMSNHTSTHFVNFALREALQSREVDQRGSLVLPEKLRFDFSHDEPLQKKEVVEVDRVVNDIIEKDLPVHAKEIPLDEALGINGIRAVFGEIYPDPVRVVVAGPTVDEILADPKNEEWMKYSIELCGGTHIESSGAAERFAVVNEEALAAGVRRITAVTGDAANQAFDEAEKVRQLLDEVSKVQGSKFKEELVNFRKYFESCVIPLSVRMELRPKLQELQEKAKNVGKRNKAGVLEDAQQYAEQTVAAIQSESKTFHVDYVTIPNPNALTTAIKAILRDCPIPVLLMSLDAKGKRVMVSAQVPPGACKDAGLKANEWAKAVAGVLGGKGGGKPEVAQGSGTDVSKLDDARDAAVEFVNRFL